MVLYELEGLSTQTDTKKQYAHISPISTQMITDSLFPVAPTPVQPVCFRLSWCGTGG